MRATIDRAWRTLCAGRSPRDVAGRIAAAFFIAATLWLCACAFLILEPVR